MYKDASTDEYITTLVLPVVTDKVDVTITTAYLASLIYQLIVVAPL